MAELKLEAQRRSVTGHKVRQLRTQGWVPAVVYGRGAKPVNIQVPAPELDRILKHGGSSQLVELHIEGGGHKNVLVREVQRHPVKRNPLHADFYAVSMREKQQVTVPIVSVGTPELVSADVVLVQQLDQVELEALPAKIPAQIEVDISGMTPDKPITVGDLPKLPGIEYLTPADEPVFNMVLSRAAAAAEGEEEAEIEYGEEGAAEPEVISRGKQEEEDAEE
jgi:large subunit ribosomal protein L25